MLLVPHAGQASLGADVEQGRRRLGSESKSSTSRSFRFLATLSLLIKEDYCCANSFSPTILDYSKLFGVPGQGLTGRVFQLRVGSGSGIGKNYRVGSGLGSGSVIGIIY